MRDDLIRSSSRIMVSTVELKFEMIVLLLDVLRLVRVDIPFTELSKSIFLHFFGVS